MRWDVWACPAPDCETQIGGGFYPGGGWTKPPRCPMHGEMEQRFEDAMPEDLRRDLEDRVEERQAELEEGP